MSTTRCFTRPPTWLEFCSGRISRSSGCTAARCCPSAPPSRPDGTPALQSPGAGDLVHAQRAAVCSGYQGRKLAHATAYLRLGSAMELEPQCAGYAAQTPDRTGRSHPPCRALIGRVFRAGLREGTDAHFYYGWYVTYGPLRRWESVVRRLPNTLRFATEFGTQSFPNLESCVRFMDADIAKIDWDHLVARHQFQANVLEHWLDWRASRSLAELIAHTQDYQIAINRYYIDRLRFHKYRPTGGIIPFLFHDPNPAVLWSIIDYWRVPKRSYTAMRLAFSPQYLFTLLHLDRHLPGVAIDLPIYVVNDAQRATSVELTARNIRPQPASSWPQSSAH